MQKCVKKYQKSIPRLVSVNSHLLFFVNFIVWSTSHPQHPQSSEWPPAPVHAYVHTADVLSHQGCICYNVWNSVSYYPKCVLASGGSLMVVCILWVVIVIWHIFNIVASTRIISLKSLIVVLKLLSADGPFIVPVCPGNHWSFHFFPSFHFQNVCWLESCSIKSFEVNFFYYVCFSFLHVIFWFKNSFV